MSSPLPVWVLFAGLVALTSVGSISTALAERQSAPGQRLSPSLSVLVAELLKLSLSVTLLVREGRATELRRLLRWPSIAFYAMPAAMYAIQNALVFWAHRSLDPGTYSVLVSTRLVYTGALSTLWLRESLLPAQWLGLGLLSLGATLVGSGGPEGAPVGSHGSADLSWAAGIALSQVVAGLSAIGGVVTQRVMQADAHISLHAQNAALYVVGIAVNVIVVGLSSLSSSPSSSAGSTLSWLEQLVAMLTLARLCAIASLAFSGMLVGALVKRAGAVVKIHATSVALVLTLLLSTAAFATPLNTPRILGASLVLAGTYAHFAEDLGPSKRRTVALAVTAVVVGTVLWMTIRLVAPSSPLMYSRGPLRSRPLAPVS